MKVKRQILVLFLTMLVEIPILSAQSKKTKEQKAEVVGKIVTSKVYKINVGTCILPCKAPILLNESDYSIEIKNDSIFSDLLYLGQADIPYRRGAELYFQAPLKNITMDIDKRKCSHQVSANTTIGNCNFYIKVYSNGSASIYITLQQGKSINFLGELNMRREETESL